MHRPKIMNKLFPAFGGISLKLFVMVSSILVIVFLIIIFININYYTTQIENNIRDHAIQASNLIKRSVRNSMLTNNKEALAITLSNIGREQYIENIRIFHKTGRIEFSTDSTDIGKTFDRSDYLCILCHIDESPQGIIPKENQFREVFSPVYGRTLSLVNPIENEPDCYNASCHAHKREETLVGYLDMTLSLRDLQISAEQTRTNTLLLSFLLIVGAAAIVGFIINKNIHRPVTQLIQGTRQVADLNLDYTIDIGSLDEFGDLARSFNIMTGKLKESNDVLKEWSSTLERRIDEKTSELEDAHKQLMLNEKMASMGRLAGVVAHELNNPMSGILTYSQLLIKMLDKKPDKKALDEAIENLKIIRDESKRCGDIVKNLLVFSRQSSGEKSQCDLKSILNQTLSLVKHSLEMNNIALTKAIANETILLRCDPAAIKQMLLSLLINAIEATTNDHGEITIKLQRIDAEKLLRIEISDNGMGIPEDVVPHIFEPYYSTKESNRNSGIGLMIVYGIVQNHEGVIQVNSREGKGTTFTIDFPAGERLTE